MPVKKKQLTFAKTLTHISWATILYTMFDYLKDATLISLLDSFLTVQLYTGWIWLISLVLLSMLMRGIRWIIIFCKSIDEKWTSSLLYHGWFFVISMLSLFRIGEISRLNWLQERNIPIGTSLSYVFVEKLADAFILAFVLALSAPYLFDQAGLASLVAGLSVIAIYFSITFLGLGALNLVSGWKPRSQYLLAAVRLVKNLLSNCLILNDIRTNISLIAFSLSIWAAVTLAFHIFITAQFPTIPLYASAMIVALVNFTGLLNLSPANIGPFELSVVVILVSFGVGVEDASVFAIMLHFLVMLATLSYGTICRILLCVRNNFRGKLNSTF